MGIFMNRIMRGERLPVFGDGQQTRAFSYVGDVADCIARSVQIPAAYGGTFNIGADKAYTINQLAAIVCTAFGVPPDIEYLPFRKEVLHAYASHDRASKVLNVKAEVSLEEGVARMAAWAQRVGARKGCRFENIEIEKELPESWRSMI